MQLVDNNGLWRLNSASFKNVIHLNEFKFPDLNGQNATITGPNGSGKTLLTDLIKATLDPAKSSRMDIVASGETKAEMSLQFVRESEGRTVKMNVSRSFTRSEGKDKAGRPSVEIDGAKQKQPGTFLSSLVNAYSLNLSAIAEDPNSLRDLILGKHPLSISEKMLKEEYELEIDEYNIPKEIFQQHALIAIDELVSPENGFLFTIRTRINDEKRQLEKSAKQADEEIPADFNPQEAEELSVSSISEKLRKAEKKNEIIEDLKKKVEKYRSDYEEEARQKKSKTQSRIDGKEKQMALENMRDLSKDLLLKSEADNIGTRIRRQSSELNEAINDELKDVKYDIQRLEEEISRHASKMKDLAEKGKESKSELDSMEKVDTSDMRKEMEQYDRTKSTLSQYKKMQSYLNEAQERKEQSSRLTHIIEKLRSDVLMDMIKRINAPVTIKDGRLSVENEHGNIVPIEDLSDAQKVLQYIDILTSIEEGFGCIIVEEGRADFDSKHKQQFDQKIQSLEKAGYQIIKAKSSDGDLRVEK